MRSREFVEPAKGNFYLVGLGIIIDGVRFTEEETHLLNYLCKHAADGDDEYLKAVKVVKGNLRASAILDRLKKTLRAVGKGPVLEAYYDRAA